MTGYPAGVQVKPIFLCMSNSPFTLTQTFDIRAPGKHIRNDWHEFSLFALILFYRPHERVSRKLHPGKELEPSIGPSLVDNRREEGLMYIG